MEWNNGPRFHAPDPLGFVRDLLDCSHEPTLSILNRNARSVRILTRYLIRLHLAPFLFSVTAVTALMLLDQVSKRFARLVGKGLPWTVIAEVFILAVPFILAMTLPMSVLIAILYTFNRLSADNEITAMKAGGVSLPRLVLPLVGAAVLLAGAMVWFNDTVLPESNHRLSILLNEIGRKKPTFALDRERSIIEVLPSELFMEAARIDRTRNALSEVTVYDERGGTRSRTIYADSGLVAFAEDETTLVLQLYDGRMSERRTNEPEAFESVTFAVLTMKVPGVSNRLERGQMGGYRGDREMSIGQMREEVVAAERLVAEVRDESRGLAVGLTERVLGRALPELGAEADTTDFGRGLMAAGHIGSPPEATNRFSSLANRERTSMETANRFSTEIHKKFSIPFVCIVFVLIGAPIAVRYRQGGVAMVVGVSLAFFCAYYVALIGGEELADRLIVTPFWAMWAPNVLFGGLGLAMLWRTVRGP